MCFLFFFFLLVHVITINHLDGTVIRENPENIVPIAIIIMSEPQEKADLLFVSMVIVRRRQDGEPINNNVSGENAGACILAVGKRRVMYVYNSQKTMLFTSLIASSPHISASDDGALSRVTAAESSIHVRDDEDAEWIVQFPNKEAMHVFLGNVLVSVASTYAEGAMSSPLSFQPSSSLSPSSSEGNALTAGDNDRVIQIDATMYTATPDMKKMAATPTSGPVKTSMTVTQATSQLGFSLKGFLCGETCIAASTSPGSLGRTSTPAPLYITIFTILSLPDHPSSYSSASTHPAIPLQTPSSPPNQRRNISPSSSTPAGTGVSTPPPTSLSSNNKNRDDSSEDEDDDDQEGSVPKWEINLPNGPIIPEMDKLSKAIAQLDLAYRQQITQMCQGIAHALSSRDKVQAFSNVTEVVQAVLEAHGVDDISIGDIILSVSGSQRGIISSLHQVNCHVGTLKKEIDKLDNDDDTSSSTSSSISGEQATVQQQLKEELLTAKEESLKQFEDILKRQEADIKARRKKLKEQEVEYKQRATRAFTPQEISSVSSSGSSSSSPSLNTSGNAKISSSTSSSSPTLSSSSSSSTSFLSTSSARSRPETLKQGFLTKQGHVVKSWRRRYFVLVREAGDLGSQLYYYKVKDDGKPIGIIVIKGAEAKQAPGSKKTDNMFILTTMNNMDKNFIIKTDTTAEMVAWMEAINEASLM
eukprot:TRINITY_DN9775_c0_g1_i3.p1 TRINITY_DN9775_c0_g1~~TRINITY_DN9775_c0_g1_i3.p1  ORF type:complete len:700 (+),score=189.29 TRINITY_DN9775_c0_g1_i3:858-2957(+)